MYIFRLEFFFSFSRSEPVTCVEMMKLDLIFDSLLQLLLEINEVWTNFWNSFFSVYYNYSGCT